jgi:hypothetical protein
VNWINFCNVFFTKEYDDISASDSDSDGDDDSAEPGYCVMILYSHLKLGDRQGHHEKTDILVIQLH